MTGPLRWLQSQDSAWITQASADRLERIESIVEKIDRKMDAIATDVVEVKIAQARTEERLNALETQMSDVKSELRDVRNEVKGQDTRLWRFVVALFLSLAGVLAKVVFFPPA